MAPRKGIITTIAHGSTTGRHRKVNPRSQILVSKLTYAAAQAHETGVIASRGCKAGRTATLSHFVCSSVSEVSTLATSAVATSEGRVARNLPAVSLRRSSVYGGQGIVIDPRSPNSRCRERIPMRPTQCADAIEAQKLPYGERPVSTDEDMP